VHLAAGAEIGVIKQSQMVGIQGKRRTKRQRVQSGMGTGGKLQLAYPSYTYNAEPGFAEHDMEEYDGVSAELAWSRSLGTARKVFGVDPDLELVLEGNLQSMFDILSDANHAREGANHRVKANSSLTMLTRLSNHTPRTRRLMSPISPHSLEALEPMS
jgi:hypothetical protein